MTKTATAAKTETAAPVVTGNAPAPAAVAAPVAAAVAKVKPAAAIIIGVSNAVPLPVFSGKRGSKPVYDVSKLEVGQSLAIKGRKARNMTSTVSGANKNDAFAVFKLDENGQPVHAVVEIKDANGNVTGTAKGDKIVLSRRVFKAVDCDPTTDPENADLRIFRFPDEVFAV